MGSDIMNNFGTLHESDGHYHLKYERFFKKNIEDVFFAITKPGYFVQWYPFATGEMEQRLGGKINFDDGEGTTYQGTITEFEQPTSFSFNEDGELINISLEEENEGCRMFFTHTFTDDAWAVNTAVGWHQCLDVIGQIINDEPVKWGGNSSKLGEIYSKAFDKELK